MNHKDQLLPTKKKDSEHGELSDDDKHDETETSENEDKEVGESSCSSEVLEEEKNDVKRGVFWKLLNFFDSSIGGTQIEKMWKADSCQIDHHFKTALEQKLSLLKGKMELVKNVVDLKQCMGSYNGIYTGALVSGSKEGIGKVKYDEAYLGDVYSGNYFNNRRNGKGEYTYRNGDRYVGYWSNSQKEGPGKFFYSNGAVYQGYFKCNKICGLGIYYYSGDYQGDKFVGQWENSRKSGIGVYYYSNGNRYYGCYKAGKDLGGILVRANGEIKREIYNEKGELHHKEDVSFDGILDFVEQWVNRSVSTRKFIQTNHEQKVNQLFQECHSMKKKIRKLENEIEVRSKDINELSSLCDKTLKGQTTHPAEHEAEQSTSNLSREKDPEGFDEKLAGFLKEIGMSNFVSAFAKEEIGFGDLVFLRKEDLRFIRQGFKQRRLLYEIEERIVKKSSSLSQCRV